MMVHDDHHPFIAVVAVVIVGQVYSAEEKRALAMITFEEKQQKDNKIVGEFRAMLQKKLGAADMPGDSSGDIQ